VNLAAIKECSTVLDLQTGRNFLDRAEEVWPVRFLSSHQGPPSTEDTLGHRCEHRGDGVDMRVRVLSVTALTALSVALTACGGDTPSAGNGGPPAGSPPAATTSPAGGTGGGTNAEGLAGITFPPGAKVSDLGTSQKQYEVTGMTLEQVKTFFEDEMIAAGYTRAQEASASRFYDKGGRRIQITWSDQQGTIRGVVRVTR
jgi:hypothetical protein